MTSKQVELLAVRAAMGEQLCARITRRAADDALVVAPAANTNFAIGALLSTVMLYGTSAAGQQAQPNSAGDAVLTGRLLPPTGTQLRLGRTVRLHSESGQDIVATLAQDGSFSVAVPPGTYDIVARNNLWQGVTVRSAVLHAGQQSIGDVIPQPMAQELFTTLGELSPIIVRGYWLRHPVGYLQYLARRLQAKFSQ
jgi:hypothetical protein